MVEEWPVKNWSFYIYWYFNIHQVFVAFCKYGVILFVINTKMVDTKHKISPVRDKKNHSRSLAM